MLSIQYTNKIIPIAIFGLALLYYLVLRAYDHTFYNMGEDGPLFLQTAKYLTTGAPSPGSPLYHLTNAAWLRVFDFGTEYATLAILSSIYSAITAALLYIITKNFLAPLLWISSAVVLSQSTILELYTLLTLIMVLAYNPQKKYNRTLAYFIIGLGLGVHHIAGMGFIALIAFDFINHRSLKPALAFFLVIPLFIYIPLTNRPPYYMIGGNTFLDYIRYFFQTASGLMGGLPLWPLDNIYGRLWDVFRVTIGGLGLSVILTYLAVKSNWREHLLPLLFGLLPLFYYLTTADSKSYFTTLPTVAFLGIIACRYDWKILKSLCVGVCAIIIGMNIFLYDFDRLDPNRTAVKFYNQLEELPPNSVLETCWCFSNSIYVNMTYLYNREHEENIYVVDTEFFRMFGGRGTDGNPSSPEIWKERITSAEKEGKLFTVETDTFLDGKIKPTTAQNVFDKYIESDFYKDSINASSS